MTKTELHEIAIHTAKASLTENNPIELSAINVKVAKEKNISPEDFSLFEGFVVQQRSVYRQLQVQKLPSQNKPASKPAPPTVKPS